MGLLDLYADTIERSALSTAARPGPAPEPTFSAWATVESGAKGVPAGLLEGFGAVRDFSSAVDKRHAEEVAAREKRLGLSPTSPYVIPGGAAARKKADEFMPDPLTAHAAQQMVGGFSKSLTKAAAAMVVAGPTGGAALFGLAEADDTAQRLQDKGIDSSTAWQVGGVVGALSAVGARLPISGAALAESVAGKVAATTALGVAGGPLSFMAQEGLSREILQRAGHADEAKLHDPLNPIGLAASMFPLVLGGFAVRASIKRVGPLKSEAAAREAMALSPAEQAHSDAFERSAGNLAELEAAVKAEKKPEARAALVAELEKQRTAAAGEIRGTAADRAAADPVAVDAARVAVADEVLARSLPDAPGAHAEMLRAADMVGAGERVEVPDLRPTVTNKAGEAFFDTRGGPDRFHGTGRPIEALSNEYAMSGDSRNIYGQGFYTTDAADISAGYMKKGGREAALYKVEHEPAKLYDMDQPLSDEVAAIVRANMGDAMPTEHGETGKPLTTLRQLYDEYRAESSNNGLSRDDVQEVFDGIRYKLEEQGYRGFEHVGGDNTGNRNHSVKIFWQPEQDVRISPAKISDYRPPAQRPDSAPALPGADQVSLKPEPVPAAPARAEGAPSPDAALAQKLAEQHPDMAVRLPGDEATTTLSAALERIKAEQLDEAGLADLFQVAVQCALTGGAAI